MNPLQRVPSRDNTALQRRGYARSMLWIILLVVVLGVLAYRFRVPLLAKLLGQDEARVRRQLNRRKD